MSRRRTTERPHRLRVSDEVMKEIQRYATLDVRGIALQAEVLLKEAFAARARAVADNDRTLSADDPGQRPAGELP